LYFLTFSPTIKWKSQKKGKPFMQINLSGHHVEITDGIKTQVQAKLSKISSHYPGLISMTVILGNERNKHTAEFNTSYEGAPISATGSDSNLFSAIAVAVKKMDAALSHRKGVLKSRQHNKPTQTEPESVQVDTEDELEEMDIDLSEYEQAS
jgi:ribosomal subunit interface protein